LNQIVAELVANSHLGLTATDRLILLTLADRPKGLRIEEIARLSGSRFRWVARQVATLTKMGILRHVAPGTYALNDRSESQS
jgi:DNA-binding IclR family transcriptional regulator